MLTSREWGRIWLTSYTNALRQPGQESSQDTGLPPTALPGSPIPVPPPVLEQVSHWSSLPLAFSILTAPVAQQPPVPPPGCTGDNVLSSARSEGEE